MAALEDLAVRVRVRASLPAPEECRRLRERAGISRAAVAEVVGVSETAVHAWETGLSVPREPNLSAYLEVLSVFRRELGA